MNTKIDFLNNKTACLVKFIKEEYIEDFLKGNIYMNTLKYFIDLEKQTKIKGMGDRYEASVVLRDVEMKIYDSETNVLVATGTTKEVTFHADERVNTPVFCMYSIDEDNLKVSNETEDYLALSPIIDEEEKRRLIEDFGDTMLMINPQLFIDRISRVCKDNSLGLIYDKVKYYDYTKNTTDRTNQYEDIVNPKMCFIKDADLKHQNEFRIILDNVITDKPYILDIGDISDIATKFKISDFFSNSLEFRYGKVRT